MQDTAKLLVAIATVNGHPNPQEWAQKVADHLAVKSESTAEAPSINQAGTAAAGEA